MSNSNQQLKILVMGCSSAGKSTFISSTLLPYLLQNYADLKPNDVGILFAGQLKNNFSLGNKKCVIIHYNSLLGLDYNAAEESLNIENESILKQIKAEGIHELFYCYTPDSILAHRIKGRSQVEPVIRGDTKHSYPRDHVMLSLTKISQRQLIIDTKSIFSDLREKFSVVFSQNKSTMLLPIDLFVNATRSQFLEMVLSDQKCSNELVRDNLHLYSSLAAGCALFMSN